MKIEIPPLQYHKCKLFTPLGYPKVNGQLFLSANIIRAYIIIEALNLINAVLHTYAIQEGTVSGDYLWSGSLISLCLGITCMIAINLIKNKVLLQIFMILFGTIIFSFHYEYQLSTYTSESQVYFEVLYIFPLISVLACEFSEKMTYICGSTLFVYMVTRATIAKYTRHMALGCHIQAAYTFYVLFMFIAITRKKLCINPSNDECEDKYHKILLNNIQAGVFKFDKLSEKVVVENSEIIRLLNKEPEINNDPAYAIRKFIYKYELQAQDGTKTLTYDCKILSIHCECINASKELFLFIVTDETPIEEIAKKKFGIRFLTYITHELRSPLNVIESSLEMLYEHIPLKSSSIYDACKKGLHSLKYLIKDSIVLRIIRNLLKSKGVYSSSTILASKLGPSLLKLSIFLNLRQIKKD